jgi:hypothetical protein
MPVKSAREVLPIAMMVLAEAMGHFTAGISEMNFLRMPVSSSPLLLGSWCPSPQGPTEPKVLGHWALSKRGHPAREMGCCSWVVQHNSDFESHLE